MSITPYDFCRQIAAGTIATFDLLGYCAEHFEDSLVAATLHWLHYTEAHAFPVVSRDGFVSCARSSEPALRSRVFASTAGAPPIEMPTNSFAADPRLGVNQPGGVASQCYGFTLSVI